jgi:hypothetical protein
MGNDSSGSGWSRDDMDKRVEEGRGVGLGGGELDNEVADFDGSRRERSGLGVSR